MTPGFSSEFKEQVRTQTDLVGLVGETISLKPLRGGSDFIGLCPFHEDHNPSFHVYPDRQSYRCWVCDEGGDCFSYVMKTDGLTFPEALRMLAERAHLEIPKTYRSGHSEAASGEKSTLYEIVAWAESEFHRCLLSSPQAARARDYLDGRGFQPETIRQFRIGYHPNEWEWLLDRARNQYSPQQLYAARLVRERDGGNGYYDDFVDRVLFPIRDMRGRPVAFGGRILPDNQRPNAPKYLNSPESKLFTKSGLLYGFDVSRDAIRRSETAVVVEGYTDCIIAHQYGLRNVVGTLGTALTETHVITLKRLARRVVQCFDGDDAGRAAAERSLAKFIAQDVDLRILTLPAGLDPADYLAEHGAETFQRSIDEATELWEHKLQLTFDRFGFETPKAREDVLNEMIGLLAQAPRLAGTAREHMLLSRLSQRVAIPEHKVREQLMAARRSQSRRQASLVRTDTAERDNMNRVPQSQSSKSDSIEGELLEAILADPSAVEQIRTEIASDEFCQDEFKALLQLCYHLAERGISPTVDRLMAELEQPEQKRVVQQIDDAARMKGVDKKLQGVEDFSTSLAARGYLEELIHNFKWRKQEEFHEAAKGRMAQQLSDTGLSSNGRKAQLEALSQIQAHHQKRTAK